MRKILFLSLLVTILALNVVAEPGLAQLGGENETIQVDLNTGSGQNIIAAPPGTALPTPIEVTLIGNAPDTGTTNPVTPPGSTNNSGTSTPGNIDTSNTNWEPPSYLSSVTMDSTREVSGSRSSSDRIETRILNWSWIFDNIHHSNGDVGLEGGRSTDLVSRIGFGDRTTRIADARVTPNPNITHIFGYVGRYHVVAFPWAEFRRMRTTTHQTQTTNYVTVVSDGPLEATATNFIYLNQYIEANFGGSGVELGSMSYGTRADGTLRVTLQRTETENHSSTEQIGPSWNAYDGTERNKHNVVITWNDRNRPIDIPVPNTPDPPRIRHELTD